MVNKNLLVLLLFSLFSITTFLFYPSKLGSKEKEFLSFPAITLAEAGRLAKTGEAIDLGWFHYRTEPKCDLKTGLVSYQIITGEPVDEPRNWEYVSFPLNLDWLRDGGHLVPEIRNLKGTTATADKEIHVFARFVELDKNAVKVLLSPAISSGFLIQPRP